MEYLSKNDLISIQGGASAQELFFAWGYITGRNFDFAVGLVNGFVNQ